MVRYGLKSHDVEWLYCDDGDDDDLQSLLDSNEDEVELPHPLPCLTNWGRTRFGLHPPKQSFLELQKRIHDPFVRPVMLELKHIDIKEQTFLPPSRLFSSRNALSIPLVEYGSAISRNYSDDGMDLISRLLHSPTCVEYESKKNEAQAEVSKKLRQLADKAAQEKLKLDQWEKYYQTQREEQHMEGFHALHSSLKADLEGAKAIVCTEQNRREAEEKLEDRMRQEKEKRDEAHRDKQQKLEHEEQRKKDQQMKVQENFEIEEAEKMKYVFDAQKLLKRLVDLREEIQPFDDNKNAAKRRLNMKKMCRGRVNALSSDIEKVRQVAFEVVASIKSEMEQDEIIRTLLQQGNIEVSADLAKGKLYYMNLLASTALIRIQAEGFNGPRGDGFPLAAFLAIVSSEIPEFNPIFEAHVYNVCPTAIPFIPNTDDNTTDDEFMESMGMTRNKTGEFESFDRFLTRTEGIISIIANIFSSLPDNHTLFGGYKIAISWLHRFLSLLPPAPIQLPLNVAPVLDSFLTGAGHMLANLCADEFRHILYQITTDIAPRLDEGSIGAPSTHRLKETLKNGYEGFLNTLPTRALKRFYNNRHSTAPEQSFVQVKEPQFGNAQSFMMDSSSNFEQGSNSLVSQVSPVSFRMQSKGRGMTNTPFDTVRGLSMLSIKGEIPRFGVFQSTDFTTAQSQGSTSSPFGILNTALPTSFGISNTPASNPFGMPSIGSSTPFRVSNSASSNHFVITYNTQSNPFGTSITGSYPFGVSRTILSSSLGAPNTASSTPFGNPFHRILSKPSSPFGSTSTEKFSSATFDSTKSVATFGVSSASTLGNSCNSAKHGFTSGSSSSFGSISENRDNVKGLQGKQPYQPKPFRTKFGEKGNITSVKKPVPCKFFTRGSCRNGNKCKFSHEIQGHGLGNKKPFGGPRR